MSNFQMAYIPIGVPTFHQESAADQFGKSVRLLKGLTEYGAYPEKPLLTLDDLKDFLHTIHPDLRVHKF